MKRARSPVRSPKWQNGVEANLPMIRSGAVSPVAVDLEGFSPGREDKVGESFGYVGKFSPKVLEQKRQILPVLDQMEYIQLHINARLNTGPSAGAGHTFGSPKKKKGNNEGPRKTKKRRRSGVDEGEEEEEKEREQEGGLFNVVPEEDEEKHDFLFDEKLCRKYPRFAQQLNIQDAPFSKLQSLHWVMENIERIFDACDRMIQRLYYRSQTYDLNPMPFPLFVMDHIRQTYGLDELASQGGWDLIASLDHFLDQWPAQRLWDDCGVTMQIFSQFLRETYDEDALFVFLTLRRTVQKRLSIDLVQEHKPRQAKIHETIGLEVVPRKCMLDGAHLGSNAISLAAQAMFEDLGVEDGLVSTYHEYFVKKLLKRSEVERKKKMGLEEGKGTICPVSIAHLLYAAMMHYESVPEEIRKLVKEGDDGRQVETMTKLKRTLDTSKQIDSIQLKLDHALLDLKGTMAKLGKVERKLDLALKHQGHEEDAQAMSKNARLKTEILLLKNDQARKEGVVNELRRQLSNLQQSVDDSWNEVTDRSRSKKRPRAQKDEVKRITFEHQGSQMFLKYLGKLTSQHAMKQNAVKKLKSLGGWKEQLKKRQEQAILLIQRTYRKRMELRRLEREAKEELLQKQKEQRERKRAQARLRQRQEDEADKHRSRMKQKEVAEKVEMKRIDARREKILIKHREAEAQRRMEKHNAQLIRRCFDQMCKMVRLSKHQRGRNMKMLDHFFQQWRQYLVTMKILFAKKISAAIKIQKMTRGFVCRKAFRVALSHKQTQEKRVRINLNRLMQRSALRCFHSWREYVLKNKRAAEFLRKNLASMTARCFETWNSYCRFLKASKLTAARRIQRAYRKYVTRRNLLAYRARVQAACVIQSAIRVYLCKTIATRVKQRREEQELKIATSLRRIRWRHAYAAFQGWMTYTKICQKVGLMFNTRMKDMKRDCFIEWRLWKQDWLALKEKCAVRIQTRWRSMAIHRVFMKNMRRNQCARKIQALHRGRVARKVAEKLYWDRDAAIKIQRLWRGKIGRKLFINRLSKYVLAHATKEHYSTVHYAIMDKHIDPRRLVDPETGDTVLHRACMNGSKRIAKLCLRKGLDVNVRNHQQQTCLHSLAEAAFLGQEMLADYLMSKGGNVHLKDSNGNTAFMRAVERGLINLVKYLVQHVDLEDKDAEGRTPLHIASMENQFQIVELLIEAGADIYCTDRYGSHPLHDLAARELLQMMAQWLPQFPGEGGLDIPDSGGRTPLHYAVVERKRKAVEMLIEWGATPYVQDGRARCPLWYATRNGDLEMMQYLVTCECSVSTQCSQTFDTPLHVACALVNSQNKIPIQDNIDETDDEDEVISIDPSIRVKIVKFLLSNGARMDVQNKQGNMPIHIAATNDDLVLVKLLVFYDCDVNVKNYAGLTPLGCARMTNAQSVIDYFNKRFIERDRQTEWELEEQRKGEALTALLGRLKFAKQLDQDMQSKQEKKKFARSRTGIQIAQELEAEMASELPPFSQEEWLHVMSTRGKLEVELGVLTSCSWKKFRVLGKPVNESSLTMEQLEWYFDSLEREEDEITYKSFWYNPDYQVFQWTTPKEVYDLPEALDNWVQQWDEAAQRMCFYNERTGRTVYPDGNGGEGIAPVAYGGKILEKRITKRFKGMPAKTPEESDYPFDSDDDGEVIDEINMNDYQRYWEEENKEMKEKLMREAAALVIQNEYRRYVGAMRAWRQRVLHKMAIRLQSKWRAFQSRKRAERRRVEHAAAKVIQCAFRAYHTRQWFIRERARIEWERYVEQMTRRLQRVWHGYLGRRLARRKYAREIYPAPRSHEEWNQLIIQPTTTLVRNYRVFNQYLVRWPDVYCYQNKVTKACTWAKPSEMAIADEEAFQELWQLVQHGFTRKEEKYATKMQTVYRGKRIREQFRALVQGVRIMRESEDRYLNHPFRMETSENDREGIVNLCNYMLKLHTIDHNMDKARPLYNNAMTYMMSRGPDNMFVLLSYACFLAATCEEEYDVIMDYVYRAHTADPSMKSFRLAETGYFRQATLDQPTNAKALLNYAICLQFYGTTLTRRVKIEPDYELAEEFYLRALASDPRDNKIVENYNFFLSYLKRADYDAFTSFQRYQERLALEHAKQVIVSQNAESTRHAASVMQKLVRGFLARVQVCKAVNTTWEKHTDEISGDEFFYNNSTGESKWDPPFGMFLVPLKSLLAGDTSLSDEDSKKPKNSIPWYICEDEKGDMFYYNIETEESSWDLPEGFTTLALATDEWEQCETDDGYKFYYNRSTGETTWDNRVIPDPTFVDLSGDLSVLLANTEQEKGRDSSWELLVNEDGQVYYHDPETGATQWDLPMELVKVGSYVHGQFMGEEYWYPGRVTGMDEYSSTFTVQYDDGDVEDGLTLNRLMLRECTELIPGMSCVVSINENAIALTGQIVSKEGPDSFTILFDDGQEESNVAAYRISLQEEAFESWTKLETDSGLVYFQNDTLRVAQWEKPLSMVDQFMEPDNVFSSLFTRLDVDRNGSLDRREIKFAIENDASIQRFIEKRPGLVLLMDQYYQRKMLLVLDGQGKGYVTNAEFQQACLEMCRDDHLEHELKTLFEMIDANRSHALDNAEMKNALFNGEVLQFVRSSPSLTGLLRPQIFSLLMKKLATRGEEIHVDNFTAYAKFALHCAKDLQTTLHLYHNHKDDTETLRLYIHDEAVIQQCSGASSKAIFVQTCHQYLQNARLRSNVMILFRLIDEDSSGSINKEEFLAAFDGRTLESELGRFLQINPHLSKLLVHPEEIVSQLFDQFDHDLTINELIEKIIQN